MGQKRLSQVLAVEKTIKNKVNDEGSAIIKQFGKPDLFAGFTKVWEKANEDSEYLEGETKICQFSASKLYGQIRARMTELLDVTLTKDTGNQQATGSLVLDGTAYVLPVTFLIWLEKQVLDLQKVISTLPTLDPAKSWRYDPNQGAFVTDVIRSVRNKPEKRVIVKYEATKEHPAQTELIEVPTVQGYWLNTYVSTAIPYDEKESYLVKVEELLKAVKQAREEANTIKIEEKLFGDALFKFLAGGTVRRDAN